jgi:hypothetical protein
VEISFIPSKNLSYLKHNLCVWYRWRQTIVCNLIIRHSLFPSNLIFSCPKRHSWIIYSSLINPIHPQENLSSATVMAALHLRSVLHYFFYWNTLYLRLLHSAVTQKHYTDVLTCTCVPSEVASPHIRGSFRGSSWITLIRMKFVSLRPFSHWGDATAIRPRKRSTALNSWRVVIASLSHWWEKRHYELKVRPVGDCKVTFSLIESQSRRLSGRTALNS